MKSVTTWTLVILALAGVSGLCAGWLYMYSLTHTVLADRDNAAQELQQLSGQDEYTRTLNILIRDTKDERVALGRLSFSNDLLDAIQMVEDAAVAAGADVSVTFVGKGEQQVGSILAVAPIILELDGSFRNIFGAVTLLETAPHLASVSQMRIEQRPGNDAWQATIRLDVGYTEERKKEAATPQAPTPSSQDL